MKTCSYYHCKKECKTKYCSEECRVFGTYKTVSRLKNYIWEMYSIVIRKENADSDGMVRCYTCGELLKWNGGQLHAGHYKHGDNCGTWTNKKNVKPQCSGCNTYRNGNRDVYAVKLEAEYGFGILQELDKAYHHPPTTWEILPLREEYRRVKKLHATLRP